MSADVDAAARPKVLSGSFPQAPLPLVAIAGLVAVVGLAMSVVGAGQTGVSVDESGHVDRLEAFIEDGLYVRGPELRGLKEGEIPPNAYVYAPGTARVMHVVNQLAGNETPAEPSKSAEAFAVRHYVVAAMSAVAVLTAFGLAWLMLGSWRWGVVAAATLVAVPMWTGHAMFNPKDTPVAVGYTLMTCAIAGLVAGARCVGWRRLVASAAGCMGMIFGIALMVGTRPGMWPGVVAAIVVAVGILALARAMDRWVLIGLVIGLVGAYAALWEIYPKIFSNPLVMMKVSVGQSTEFPKGLAPGREYVFERTAIEWPILLLTFMVVGTAIGAWLCLRPGKMEAPRAVAIAVVGAQAYALTLAAVITKANLYDGLRQLLFAVPAQAALATIGMAAVVGIGRRKLTRWLLPSVAVLALALPMIVQARLYPYQYGYGNLAAERLGAPILDDTWKVSFREHVEEIPPNLKAICPNAPPWMGPISDEGRDCRGSYGVIKPHWLAYWHHARYNPDSPAFYTVLRARRPVPPNCHVVHDVVRHRNLERAIMSRLLLCTKDFPGLIGYTGGSS